MSNSIKNKTTIFKIFQRNILKDDLFRHTAIMLVGTKLGDIFNLVYRLAMVRLLTVEEYGIFNSLIVFSMIICQFVSPFQPALTKFIAEYISREQTDRLRFVLKRVGRDLFIFSILVLIIFIIASGSLATYLKISVSYYVIMVGILVVATILCSLPSAFLQGAQLFTSLAWIAASSALLKLIIGVGLVYLGLGITGGLSGFIIGPIFLLVVAGFIMVNFFSRLRFQRVVRRPIPIGPIYKYFIPTGLTLGALWILSNIDVILVKKFFSPLQAGYYSVAQMVGLIILYLPGAVTIVLFPKVAAARAQNISSGAILKKGIFTVAIFCLLGNILCWAFPEAVLKIISGKANPESCCLVPWFALAMSFCALSFLVGFYHLATHNTKIVLPLILIAALEVITIYVYHPTLKSVLMVVFGYSVIAFFCLLYMLKYPTLIEEKA